MKTRFEAFAGSIIELNRNIHKIKDIEMKKLKLKGNHAMCLYYLGQHEEGLTATELTSFCKEDKSAISRCLHQLNEKELVSCDRYEKKRSYRTRLHLTEEGKKIAAKINERIEVALFTGGDGLTEEQRRNFYDSMEIIKNNLSRYIKEQENAI